MTLTIPLDDELECVEWVDESKVCLSQIPNCL
jgi:hypothetical protein